MTINKQYSIFSTKSKNFSLILISCQDFKDIKVLCHYQRSISKSGSKSRCYPSCRKPKLSRYKSSVFSIPHIQSIYLQTYKVICNFKLKMEGHNLENLGLKVKSLYLYHDQDLNPQPKSPRILTSHSKKNLLNFHCYKKNIMNSQLLQRSVT